MNPQLTRLDRCAVRRGIAAVCGCLALFGAATPVRGQCDPQELSRLIATDAAAGDQFGSSVAVDGDTAVVGAYFDDLPGGIDHGSAYVFVRTGGVWTQQAKLTASDAATQDNFGVSVAISGDTVVVGAWGASVAGISNAGAAYVFVRAGTAWTQQQKLIASDLAVADVFGWSVEVSGDTAMVGARSAAVAGMSNAGAAYVFTRAGAVWSQQQKLTASDAAGGDQFGWSVQVSGDTAVLSAHKDDHSGFSDAGSAYVFVRSGTVWTEQAKVISSDPANGDLFGESVALSGDTTVIGGHTDDLPGGLTNAGSAFVFVRSGSNWTQQAKLIASDALNTDNFGYSVALSGDVALVGALRDDHAGGDNAGSAYVFVRSGGVWAEQAQLIASDAADDDFFGNSVALSGDTALIGAWEDNHAGGANAGAAYVFDLGCTSTACCAGDFDGDNIVTDADVPDFIAELLAGAACPAPPACCPGDFNSDELVDGADTAGFLAKLFSGGACP